MQGAREYAKLFSTGQIGRLYIVSGSHARGKTFQIYVLPEGMEAKPNGPNNPPVNCDAVEVYGITGGQPGWTEQYGWLHIGRWQEDFAAIVESRKKELAAKAMTSDERNRINELAEKQRIAALLASY